MRAALLEFALQVLGFGPRPFGYFCIAPQHGAHVAAGAEETLDMRLLPLCCGSFCTQVPIAVFPPISEDVATPELAADAVDLSSLIFPVSFEVSAPRVSACWPPEIDFGIVRLLNSQS